jgi:uroporphyrinogen-III synthase
LWKEVINFANPYVGNMVKNGAKNVAAATNTIKKILITQPRPETDKSP